MGTLPSICDYRNDYFLTLICLFHGKTNFAFALFINLVELLVFRALLALNCSIDVVDNPTGIWAAADALVSIDIKSTLFLALLHFLAYRRRHISTNDITDLKIV